MGISTDVQVMEDLKLFKSFFEFVKTPDKYSSLIEKAEEVAKEMRAVVEAHTVVSDVLAYKAGVEDKLWKEAVKLDKRVEEQAKKEMEWNQHTAKVEGELAADRVKLETEKREVKAKAKLLEVALLDVSQKQEALAVARRNLDEGLAKLEKQKAEFNAKLDALRN